MSILISVLYISCNNASTCDNEIESVVNTAYYIQSENEYKNVAIKGMSIWGHGVNDSLLQEESDSVPTIALPLRVDADNSVFLLKKEEKMDTIMMFYSTSEIFESPQCGFNYRFTLDSILHTENVIDSISIINNDIYNEYKQNIEIYF